MWYTPFHKVQNLSLEEGKDNLLLLKKYSAQKIRENMKGTQNSPALSWIWKYTKARLWKCRRENIETSQLARGGRLCKRSSIHTRDNTIAQERLSDSSCCGDKTRLGGESHPSSLFTSRPWLRLPLSMQLLCHNWPWKLSALPHFLLSGLFVEMFWVAWCKRPLVHTRCDIHQHWIWLIGNFVQNVLHLTKFYWCPLHHWYR